MLPRKHTLGCRGASSKRSSRILTTASSAMFGFCGFVVLMEMLREHPYSQCAGSAYFLVKMGLDEPEHPICFRLRHARNISLLLDGVLKIPKWAFTPQFSPITSRPPLLFKQRLDDRPLVGQVHARLVLRVDVSPRPYNAAAAVPGKAETRRHYRTHRARSGQGGVGWLCPNPRARVCPNPPATISSLALHPRSASNLTAFRTPKVLQDLLPLVRRGRGRARAALPPTRSGKTRSTTCGSLSQVARSGLSSTNRELPSWRRRPACGRSVGRTRSTS